MDKIELYKKIVRDYPDLEVKGAKMPYTASNGNMFSFYAQDQLHLRLSQSDREAFIKKHNTNLSVQHGVVMKEYVIVPDTVFTNDKLMKLYFKLSYEYTLRLKAKPTTRKKSRKK